MSEEIKEPNLTDVRDENMKSIFDCWNEALRRFFDVNGRTTRYEFWAFQTVSLFIFLLAALVGFMFNAYRVVFEIFALYFLAPATTVSIRRLHDLGQSGWWALPIAGCGLLLLLNSEFAFINDIMLVFITLSYMSYLYWLLSAEGDDSENAYGSKVQEPEIYNQDSRVFITFMIVFLIGLWLTFFIRIF